MTSNAFSSNRPGRSFWMGILMFILCSTAAAQTTSTDQVADSAAIDRIDNERYEAYVRRAHERWLRLIPNISVLQYAGDIGMVSAGIGWDYGKHNRWETLILMGYLPKFEAGHSNDLTFTLKENLVPWNVDCGHGLTVQPACFTLFLNSIFDDEFWTEEPDRYPSSYYGFSSRIRFSIGFGGRVSLDIPQQRRLHGDRISLYYELNTCDLFIVSAVPNSRVTLGDILRLGLGVQYRFF